MKANEFIVEYSPVDQIRTSMYRNLGMGGDAANEIAGRENFVNRFIQQVKQNQKASGKSGMPLDVDKMVRSYLGQYGWVADEQQQAQLSKLANAVANERGIMGGSALYSPNLKKLANAMYTVGSQQLRDPKSGLAMGGNGAQGAGQPGAPGGKPAVAAAAAPEELSPATEQVIQKITKLIGPENHDDLERIAKTAMQVLWRQNPKAYTDLYREIMSGTTKKKVQPVQQPDASDNPNIVQGYNESRKR